MDLFDPIDRETLDWLEFGASRVGLNQHYVTDQQALYQQLCDECQWSQPAVFLFGKRHKVPRLNAFYGDSGVEYRYSGLTHRAEGWPASLQMLKTRIDSLLGTRFNTVLLNWYRDGGDTMGYHADDEAVLGPEPTIASISLGAPRRFVMKRRNDPKVKREVMLEGGSLPVMAGRFQHDWLHAVPAARRVREGRINLTFRRVNSPEH
ncbi:alkylated DNA repair dioxygenase AlkB [Litorivivens lipolytica]|uniref:Alkylated DNA repair dioxygenase AlkB n=1 Tax=Litorivivens lipolytica TaxID=1524264 RepID=A0A7W4Z494_9GAMM|nr:alpha-ketoglutarate-dependent dioxygenase AlkB [Litorivivens lipolytica]MBB3046309.1 alkylated DNA repair dioxygenase AlkB [Litorivivens lipolytica]